MYFVVLYPSISQIIAFDHFQRSSKRGGSQGVTIAKRGHGPTTVDTSNTAFNITDDQCHPKLCACLSTMTYVRWRTWRPSLENHNHNRLAQPKPSCPNLRPKHEIALANGSTMALVSLERTSRFKP